MDQEQEETRQEEEEEEEEISDEEDCEHSSKDSTRLQLPLEQAEEPEDSHTGHIDDGEYIHKIIDSSNNSDCDNDNMVVDSVALGDYVEDVVIKEEDVDAPDASIKEEDIVPDEPRRVSWTGRAVVACLLLGWGVFLTYCYLTLSPTCTPVTLHCPDPSITFTAQVGYLHTYLHYIYNISTLHRAAAPRCGCTWGRGWGSATSAVWTWRRWWRPAPSTTATPTPPPAR